MVLQRGWISYTTDEGVDVAIKVSANTASENGDSVSQFPTENKFWPYLEKDLRHILGVASGGTRAKMVVASPSVFASLNIGSDTFLDGKGRSNTITSKIGERQNARDLR